MSESQNIEYKESWRDEYLKWICGFANAQGGTIFIGIDDSGNVVGVKDCKKLMEDIPNKIQAGLGIVADVNKKSKGGLDYIENWGCGIEKICDACRELGSELPVYEVRGNTIRVHFKALKEALVEAGATKDQNDTLDDTLELRILELIRKKEDIKQEELAEKLNVSVPTIKRAIKRLSVAGKIVRKGGKRFGYWEIIESTESEK